MGKRKAKGHKDTRFSETHQLTTDGLLVYGLGGGLLVSMDGGQKHSAIEIVRVETVRWSWADVQTKIARVLIIGLGIGLFVGVSSGLVLGLVTGLATMLGSLLVVGLRIDNMESVRTKPNQGIWVSFRMAWRVALAGGLFFVLCIGLFATLLGVLAFGLGGGLAFGIGGGLAVGLLGMLMLGLIYGGHPFMQHFTLRWLLTRNDFAPRNYADFLDYCTERILLRRIGGGWIFVHRLLLEYFVELGSQIEETKHVESETTRH